MNHKKFTKHHFQKFWKNFFKKWIKTPKNINGNKEYCINKIVKNFEKKESGVGQRNSRCNTTHACLAQILL